MIKQLRLRFIIIATCSTAAVLLLIIGSINIINYHTVNQKADDKLEILALNNGEFPMDFNGKPAPLPDKMNPSSSKNKTSTTDDHDTEGQKPPLHGNLPAEAAFDTRFFTVTLTKDGTITEVKTDHIAAVSSDVASLYAQDLISKDCQKGFLSQYKYCRIVTSDENYMYIFVDCERELSSFRMFLLASIGISLLGLFLVFLLVLILSKRVVKPIVESYEKQKSFITNASHELKTPLTIIDANMEVLEMVHGEDEWTTSSRKQVQRLADLTNKLVLLSRMEESDYSVPFSEVAISDLVEETVLPYEALALSCQKHLTTNVTPDLQIYGDRNLLSQVITLLMDNAMKYSSDNGNIELVLLPGRSTNTTASGVTLTIKNSVDEIAVGKHNEFFDRFYRGDESHSSVKSGHGIGLSVANAIVSAHKGRISAVSEDGKSLTMSVYLP